MLPASVVTACGITPNDRGNMGIAKKMMKGGAYVTVAKKVAKELSPGKETVEKAASKALGRISPARRRRRTRNRAMFTGLVAAAVAVPLGILLGRRYLTSDDVQGISASST
jgi:hypothetical protein